MGHGRKVSVTGLGYVGLPVAIALGGQGRVIGFDVDATRIEELRAGFDRTHEVSVEALKGADLALTAEPAALTGADFHIIAVPTPIDADKQPDLDLLYRASETMGRVLKPGDIVVYESTVYPGATEEECVPILERHSGLRAGEDFHVGYSPERINPGDREHTLESVKKIVAAQSPDILNIVDAVYSSVVRAGTHRAPSIRVAEAAKSIENIQRDLNIALMNELSLIFDRLGIDTNDVIEAAASKWNFMRFAPGLVGGHCIGVDPYYLVHKARTAGYSPEVILAGRNINDGMGRNVAEKLLEIFTERGIDASGSRITVLGITFKENIPDIRNSGVVAIVRTLQAAGAVVQVHDPHADVSETQKNYGVALCAEEKLAPADAIILAVAHAEFARRGWPFICGLLARRDAVVIDIKGVLARAECPADLKLWRM